MQLSASLPSTLIPAPASSGLASSAIAAPGTPDPLVFAQLFPDLAYAEVGTIIAPAPVPAVPGANLPADPSPVGWVGISRSSRMDIPAGFPADISVQIPVDAEFSPPSTGAGRPAARPGPVSPGTHGPDVSEAPAPPVGAPWLPVVVAARRPEPGSIMVEAEASVSSSDEGSDAAGENSPAPVPAAQPAPDAELPRPAPADIPRAASPLAAPAPAPAITDGVAIAGPGEVAEPGVKSVAAKENFAETVSAPAGRRRANPAPAQRTEATVSELLMPSAVSSISAAPADAPRGGAGGPGSARAAAAGSTLSSGVASLPSAGPAAGSGASALTGVDLTTRTFAPVARIGVDEVNALVAGGSSATDAGLGLKRGAAAPLIFSPSRSEVIPATTAMSRPEDAAVSPSPSLPDDAAVMVPFPRPADAPASGQVVRDHAGIGVYEDTVGWVKGSTGEGPVIARLVANPPASVEAVAASPVPAWPPGTNVPAPAVLAFEPGRNPAVVSVPPGEKAPWPDAGAGAPPSDRSTVEADDGTYRKSRDADLRMDAGLLAKRGTVASPGARNSGTLSGRAANLAAVYAGNLPRNVPEADGAVRSFLSNSSEQVMGDEPVLGTGVAQSAPVMSAASLIRQPSSEAGDHVSARATATLAGESPRPAASTSPATSAAHRAVATVLETVERFATGSAPAVNLRFSVGGSDLAVRVELRGGEMHATFRTDSTELRTVLAQEWQSMCGSEAGRSLRAIEPVFVPARSTGFGAASGEGAPQQQRDPGARQFDEPIPARPSAVLPSESLSTSDPVASAPRLVPLATALRLHTFA
jgi:hypothetical protein